MAALLRRFYGCAQQVPFPEAIIDTVVGDQVMASTFPTFNAASRVSRYPASWSTTPIASC